MRTLRLAIATLVAAAALTGCGDDEPDPGDSMSTWTPSGTIETPSSTAPPEKPTEPALPDAATKATEDGARAFITYYWDLVNYAQLTGDVKALKAVSGDTCEGCQNGILGVEEHYGAGGSVEGGYAGIKFTVFNQLKGKSKDLYGFEAQIEATRDEQTVISPDGSEDVRSAGTEVWNLYVLWLEDTGWRLDIMEHES